VLSYRSDQVGVKERPRRPSRSRPPPSEQAAPLLLDSSAVIAGNIFRAGGGGLPDPGEGGLATWAAVFDHCSGSAALGTGPGRASEKEGVLHA
jgi:hypothetical protein